MRRRAPGANGAGGESATGPVRSGEAHTGRYEKRGRPSSRGRREGSRGSGWGGRAEPPVPGHQPGTLHAVRRTLLHSNTCPPRSWRSVMVIVLPRAMSSMVNSERIISPEPLRWIRYAPSAARLRPATERTRPRRSERHGSTATHATTDLTLRGGRCVPVVQRPPRVPEVVSFWASMGTGY